MYQHITSCTQSKQYKGFFTLEYCWWFVSVFKALIEIYHNITMWQIDQKISSRIEGLNVRIHRPDNLGFDFTREATNTN